MDNAGAKASVTLMVAAPGFGKTAELQKAIADWNLESARATAIIQCDACDTVESIIIKVDEQWKPASDSGIGSRALFLDNTHHLEISVESQLLRRLIHAMKPTDYLWVASRRMPDLPLLQWQNSHQIRLIQEAELVSNTEGCWPLVYGMRKNNWHQAALHSQINQYLQQEFMLALSDEEIRFLSQLAWFEELTPALWKRLNISAVSLFDVWQKYRFIYPAGADSETFVWVDEVRIFILQYYPLNPAGKKSLLVNASDYWLRNGCFQLLIDTLYDDSEAYLHDNGIIIPLVIALIFTRRFHQARFVLEQISATQKDIFITDDTILVLTRILALFSADENDPVYHEEVPEVVTSDNDVIHSLSMLLSIYQDFYHGCLDEAARQARDALSYMNEHQQFYLTSLAEMLLIACDKYRGYTLQASQQLELAYHNKKQEPHDPAWQNYAAGIVVLSYEKNDIGRARELCEKVIPHVNQACSTEVIVHFYIYYSRLLTLSGEHEKSFEYLVRLQRFLSLGHYPRYQGKLVVERMRQSVMKDDQKSMRYLHEKFDLACVESVKVNEMRLDVRDYLSQAKAMQLVYDQQCDAAIALLVPLRDIFLKHDYQVRALIAEAQIIVAYAHKGEAGLAAEKLIEAVIFYGWSLFNRTLFDEVPGITPVLMSLIQEGRLRPDKHYLGRYQDILTAQDNTESPCMSEKLQLLTLKEREVLFALTNGQSNQDIANRLGIAATTIKWHLKNIYRKLEVENRAAAIAMVYQNKQGLQLHQ